jgi:hypothetical protein
MREFMDTFGLQFDHGAADSHADPAPGDYHRARQNVRADAFGYGHVYGDEHAYRYRHGDSHAHHHQYAAPDEYANHHADTCSD